MIGLRTRVAQSLLLLGALAALAATPPVGGPVNRPATGKKAPPAGNQCMETDYDCQPTSLSAKDYDKMALSVPVARDLPALVELEPLDPADAKIQRFMLNARGIMGREVPIEASKDQFCTLSHATNVTLTYFPSSGLWTFVIGFNPESELMAGGSATCLNLKAGAQAAGERP